MPTSATLAKLNAAGDHFHKWMRENGGFDLGETLVRMVVQGGDLPVAIVNIRAEVVQRLSIPTGTLFIYPGGDGDGDALQTKLNLDLPELSASYFADHIVTVAPGKFVAIDIGAFTRNSAVVWNLAVDMIVAGTRRTVIVTPDDTEHYRTTTAPNGADTPQYSRSFIYGHQPEGWRICALKGC